MKFKALLELWKEKAGPSKTDASYAVRLSLTDAARLHALAEMFPGRRIEALITDLLTAGLDEIAACMPYERGEKVVSQDEHGDPIYEDVGLTPRFIELTRKYTKSLKVR